MATTLPTTRQSRSGLYDGTTEDRRTVYVLCDPLCSHTPYQNRASRLGADSILTSLVWDEGWCLDELPSRSSVAAFLNQSGLTKRYGDRTPLPEPAAQTVTRPYQEWELDAMGEQKVKGIGKVALINIIDVLSSLKVESYPCLEQRNPSTPEYYLTLRRAFMKFGLPERITFDRGTVFYDNTNPSPWPTKLLCG